VQYLHRATDKGWKNAKKSTF